MSCFLKKKNYLNFPFRFILGVTPLYDAASNGHLRIVELLLDKGASAIIKTDDGDTPLNILKEWCIKNDPNGEDLILYESLITRMTEIMQRTGQKIVENNYSAQKQNTKGHRVNKENLKRNIPKRDRTVLLDLEDDDDEIMSGIFCEYNVLLLHYLAIFS